MQSIMNKLLFVMILGAGIGFIIIYIRYIEIRTIFFPAKGVEADPSSIGLPFEDVYMRADDGVKINGWFTLKNGAEYTVLFCHGNAGNISHRLDKMRIFSELGVNVLIIDYRGYGRSEGSISEKGFYKDVSAAYDYLIGVRRVPAEKIILFGESLGTAAVIDLASKVKVKGLIVEGAFSNALDMAKMAYPFLPAFILSSKLDSLSKIGKIDSPKLFIHSSNDEIIPVELAKKLFDAAGGDKEFVEITGGHNSAFMDSKEKYVAALKSFIAKI